METLHQTNCLAHRLHPVVDQNLDRQETPLFLDLQGPIPHRREVYFVLDDNLLGAVLSCGAFVWQQLAHAVSLHRMTARHATRLASDFLKRRRLVVLHWQLERQQGGLWLT